VIVCENDPEKPGTKMGGGTWKGKGGSGGEKSESRTNPIETFGGGGVCCKDEGGKKTWQLSIPKNEKTQKVIAHKELELRKDRPIYQGNREKGGRAGILESGGRGKNGTMGCLGAKDQRELAKGPIGCDLHGGSWQGAAWGREFQGGEKNWLQ